MCLAQGHNPVTLVRLEPAALCLKSSTLPLSHFLLQDKLILFCLVGLRFYIPVKSYGHVELVSSPNHTVSVSTYFRFELTTALLNQRKEDNDHRNNFMINLHESIGPGRDSCDTCICSQTRYRLRYRARYLILLHTSKQQRYRLSCAPAPLLRSCKISIF